MNAAVFLDRDNTLIHNDGDLGDPDKVRLIQGSASAIASLQGLGYKIVVVTNQGGVARGKYTEADVDAVHRRVNELVQANSGAFIDRFYYCPYHPEGSERRYRRDHPWRKPEPGMLLQAAKHLDLDMSRSWMVGDQVRDIQAGYAAGTTPILIDPKGEKAGDVQSMPPAFDGDNGDALPVTIEPNRDYFIARSLIEAARIIGQKRRPPAAKSPEKKASRVVVEPPSVVGTPAPAKKKVTKKKVRRRPKATSEETRESVEVEQKVIPGPASRGEAPSKQAPSRSANHPSEANEDEVVHAPTLTMPSLSPDIDLDDDDSAILEPSVHVVKQAAKAPTLAEDSRDVPSRAERPLDAKSDRRGTELPKTISEAAPSQIEEVAKDTTHSDRKSENASSNDPLLDQPASASDRHVDQTLRQILAELRNQRLTGSEFSYVGVMAIVLQVVAIICLLAALLMGSGNDQIFIRWIGCAIVLQLGTVALLLFKK